MNMSTLREQNHNNEYCQNMGIVRSACIYEKALREAGFNDLTRKKLIHVDFKPQVAWIAKGHSYDLVAKQKRNIHKSSDYVDEMFPNQLI
jgi:hypothetical protein